MSSPALAGLATPFKLNSTQVHLVRKSWAAFRSKGKHEPGLTILTHSFALKKEIRPLFEMGDEGSGKYLNYHRRLKEHAAQLNLLLELVVSNLDTHLNVEDKVKEIGRLHVPLRAHGFKHTFWDVFAKSLLDYLIGNGNTLAFRRKRETQVAWTEIVCFITGRLKDGYNEELRLQKRRRTGQRESSFDSRASGSSLAGCPMEALARPQTLSTHELAASLLDDFALPHPHSGYPFPQQPQPAQQMLGRASHSQPQSRIPSLDVPDGYAAQAQTSNFLSPHGAGSGRRSPKLGHCGPLSRSFDGSERRRTEEVGPPDAFLTRSPNRRRSSNRMLQSMGFSHSFELDAPMGFSDVESPCSPYSRSSGASSGLYPGWNSSNDDDRFSLTSPHTHSLLPPTPDSPTAHSLPHSPRSPHSPHPPLSAQRSHSGAPASYHPIAGARMPTPPHHLRSLDSGYNEPPQLPGQPLAAGPSQAQPYPAIQLNDAPPADSSRFRFKTNYQMSLDLPRDSGGEETFVLQVQAPTPVDTPRDGFWGAGGSGARPGPSPSQLGVPSLSPSQRRLSAGDVGGRRQRLRPQASMEIPPESPGLLVGAAGQRRGSRAPRFGEKSASFSQDPQPDAPGRRHASDSAISHRFQ